MRSLPQDSKWSSSFNEDVLNQALLDVNNEYVKVVLVVKEPMRFVRSGLLGILICLRNEKRDKKDLTAQEIIHLIETMEGNKHERNEDGER